MKKLLRYTRLVKRFSFTKEQRKELVVGFINDPEHNPYYKLPIYAKSR